MSKPTPVDSLLKLLIEALPEGNVLPYSMYEARKIIKDLGLDYVKIDACVDDCILYRGKYEKLVECPICKKRRWKPNKNKKVSNKIVRYFLIKQRLQRLFMLRQITEDMKWHKNKRVDDGVLRHPGPADSLTWKTFDDQYGSFFSDPCNVRLGLALDGFTPFGIMGNENSMWPVILIPYNLPPWLCMKQSNFMLSLLISSIAMTLCKLERIFLPSFFEVMVHLPIHLANEARLGGPVQYWWMYPVESYVRNKARPEGSIAERYVAEECMTFCARYLVDMDSRLHKLDRYIDCESVDHTTLSMFKINGRPIGRGSWENMNLSEIQQAPFYILQNCDEVQPWIE
uniref:DUF4218 domain-containing protein n=1 Tax=Cajanus cajan TaxID=3821 RepID=A0A151SQY1_CAJCA|nr:hypothetical protein KK1_003502 [Cajanus cajan]